MVVSLIKMAPDLKKRLRRVRHGPNGTFGYASQVQPGGGPLRAEMVQHTARILRSGPRSSTCRRNRRKIIGRKRRLAVVLVMIVQPVVVRIIDPSWNEELEAITVGRRIGNDVSTGGRSREDRVGGIIDVL
jgi:hypothetical protein